MRRGRKPASGHSRSRQHEDLITRYVYLIAVSLLGTACADQTIDDAPRSDSPHFGDDEQGADNEHTPDNPGPNNAPPNDLPAPDTEPLSLAALEFLPQSFTDADCAEIPPIELCEFAPTIDAFVVGEVLGIDASPFWYQAGPDGAESLNSCDSSIPVANPGLTIRVRVSESAGASVPEDLTIFVGEAAARLWNARSLLRDDVLEWNGGDGEDEAPMVGQNVGFFIQRNDEAELWTLFYSMPLGEIHVPEREEAVVVEAESLVRSCMARPNLEELALTARELLAAFEDCDNIGTSTDLDRYGSRVDAASTHAGMCVTDRPVDATTCEVDADCTGGLVCDVRLECVRPEDRTPMPRPD